MTSMIDQKSANSVYQMEGQRLVTCTAPRGNNLVGTVREGWVFITLKSLILNLKHFHAGEFAK